MIRFVDLRGQECNGRFAFFDTTMNSFMVFNHAQAFDDWADLEASLKADPEMVDFEPRLKRLCPEWVFKAGPDPFGSADRSIDAARDMLEFLDFDGHPDRNDLLEKLAVAGYNLMVISERLRQWDSMTKVNASGVVVPDDPPGISR